MAFNDGNNAAGLTAEQMDKVLQLQDLTGVDDMSICRDVLQRHSWNLEVAVQEQLNIKEGRPSIYASESRPPAVISDLHGQHAFFAAPPPAASGGPGGGVFGLARALFDFICNMCYGTIMALLNFGRQMIRGSEPPTDPLDDVMNFISYFEDKYAMVEHPVFYQGTFSQVLNDAKRELRFLIVYLHKDDCSQADAFCRETLTHPDVVNYINARFLFWTCSLLVGEGRRAQTLMRTPTNRHSISVLVLRDNSMAVVGRLEGVFRADALIQRLMTVVADFEINLVQTRADRYEASVNRSLRAHQDEAFMESLRADQEKERRREEERQRQLEAERAHEAALRAEEERRRDIARQKIDFVDRVPAEPDPNDADAVHVVFKLPSGRRLERRFLTTHTLEAIFYFVFCHPSAPDSFEITTNFPKKVLKCRPEHAHERIMTLAEAGLTNREVLFVNDLDA